MKYADLHIHSIYSDGAHTPEEIINFAIKNNVKCISITDHDSIGSQYVVDKYKEKIDIISGIELSAEYNDMEIHILGYYIDVTNENLIENVKILNNQRIRRVERILENLKKYNIYLELED